MKLILPIVILLAFTSCSTRFDFKEADKLVETLRGDSRIHRLTINSNNIFINGQKKSTTTTEIEQLNKNKLNYVFELDSSNSISLSKKELESLLHQLKKTKAYSVQYLDAKAYFIMDSFLDSSNGFLYSDENLKLTTENNKSDVRLTDGNIRILEKVKPNWYKVGAWH